MIRILTYVYVALQIAILLQIKFRMDYPTGLPYLPNIDTLKIIEIIIFAPIILVLASRTRKLRDIHISKDEY